MVRFALSICNKPIDSGIFFLSDKKALKGRAIQIADVILSALGSLPLLNIFVIYYAACEKPHNTVIIYQLLFSTQPMRQAQIR